MPRRDLTPKEMEGAIAAAFASLLAEAGGEMIFTRAQLTGPTSIHVEVSDDERVRFTLIPAKNN